MKQFHVFVVLVCMALAQMLTGCGGGGGGPSSATVSGIAAAGAPLVGTVKIKDSSSTPKVLTKALEPDGSFSFDVSELVPPFILRATGTVGQSSYNLHSFSTTAGTANVNPLTNLIVALSAGGLDPGTIYDSPSTAIVQTVTVKLAAATNDLLSKMHPVLALYNATGVDPITGEFNADHRGLDEVLDMMSFTLSGGTVTVRNKATTALIISGHTSSPNTWQVDLSKAPTPPVRAVVFPIYAKIGVGKSASFSSDVLRSADKRVTWSVVESGGGAITNTGVYTAPSVEGTYHVKVISTANPALPATAIVKVVPDNVSVSIAPSTASLTPGSTKSFTATVTGTSTTQVTWSVVEASGGNISSTGLYTAPASAGTYHVKATSVSDPTKNATATVTVTAPTSGGTTTGSFPFGTWVGPSGVSFTIDRLGQEASLKYYVGTISYAGLTNGKVTTTGNIATDSINGMALLGSQYGVSFVVIDMYNMTHMEASLTQNPSNPNKLEGYLIVIPLSGPTINESNAVFTRQ